MNKNISYIKTEQLKPHPKNEFYFSKIDGYKYEEIKKSIKKDGVRIQLVCNKDGTIISGHQRWRIAKDLNIKEIPVEFINVDEITAETLLITSNTEQRSGDEIEKDPIKIARIVEFLRRHYKSNDGKVYTPEAHRALTEGYIADALKINISDANSYIKLEKYLIPEILEMVSNNHFKDLEIPKKLSSLSDENQRNLYQELGPSRLSRLNGNSLNKWIKKMNGDSKISEKDLNKMICKDINVVQHGLKLIKSEYPITDGKIDILAIEEKEDKKILWIIELKIEHDCKKITWQCAYYRREIRKLKERGQLDFSFDDIKVVTICPDYSYEIRESLDELGSIHKMRWSLDGRGKLKIRD